MAGLPCLTGSAAREGNVPDADATVVERVKRAGAVVLAKTTVPEYMWSYETESVPHGRTLNAFDPARTSGGSSGGEAALIGGGGSLLGIGTDGGGSIRVPSHYNGIAGLRPSARLVPETGCWPASRETGMLDMACVGPMARTVADLAMTLAVIAGGDGIDPFVGPAQLGDHRGVAIAGLRVGFYARRRRLAGDRRDARGRRARRRHPRRRRRARRGGRPAGRRRGGGPVLQDDGRRRRRPRARRSRRRGRAPRAADDLAAREPRAARALGRRVLRGARALERVPLAHAAVHRATTTS